ncbi:MAG: hypothetical protein KAJ19_26260 [Gammaproteobacteria bacterium]|nr:hypothetical protein [Gammaproteobacteria bacterium]
MNFDYLNTNIYKSTEYAYAQNLSLILGAALLLLVVEIAKPVFDLNASSFAAEMFLEIWIAYAFHTTILLGVSSSNWRDHFKVRKNNDQLKPFMWRSFAFIGVGGVITIPVAMIVIVLDPKWGGNDYNSFLALFTFIALVVGAPLYGAVFALFGTILPASVSGDDSSFTTAFRRAKGLFWFTFGRFIIGPILFLAGLNVLIVLLAKMDFKLNVYGENGISVIGMAFSFLFYVAQLFAVGLTATVLCKTYLKSKEATEQNA